MKRFISVLLSIIFLTYPSLAKATYLYTETQKETVANGIVYETRNILTENTWIKAYIAYVDITNPNTQIKVMTSQKGSSYLENVKSMAERENATVAINGDFFNMTSSQTNMLGMVYKNGELISSPAKDNQASFVVTEDNEVIMDYFSLDANVISPQGYSCPIYQINKVPVSGGAITMLTSAWGSKTWGNGLSELIVENDIVKEKRVASDGAGDMPSNGYVLVTNAEVNSFFDNFEVGDTVTVETFISPDIDNIKEATGGNTVIVENGEVAKFTGNVSGYAQRSSVGISKDKKTLILVATDGRQDDCRGLTQTELAKLMISLGADKAINLDGGGSTTFVKKDSSGKMSVQNNVSSLRAVSTAIAATDKGIKGKIAKQGVLKADKDTILLHDSVKLEAQFYDEYGLKFETSDNAVKFFDAQGNSLKDGVFMPQSTGKHTVYAACNDVICSADITVTDKINSIDITSDDNIELENGKTFEIKVVAYDTEGNRISVNPKLIKWESTNNNIKVKDGIISANKKESAIISAGYDGKYDYITVNRNENDKKAPFAISAEDEFKGSLKDGTKIAVSGSIPNGLTLLNRYFSLERLKKLKNYEKSFVTKNYYSSLESQNIKQANGYSVYIKDGTAFATISTSNGKLKNASEWANLYIASTGTSKNLVIITEKAPDELPNEEKIRIKKILGDASERNKNVFYVYSGYKPQVNIENGIRYISCPEVSEYKTTNMEYNKDYCAYVEFYVNGNEIKYDFVS